jgi:uncharacterized HAD superfamily protein
MRIILIDIDGTVCDDIKNEDSHLYGNARCYYDALDQINKWYDEGNHITFFTAREEKDRVVTEDWLNRHGFKYNGIIMGKPRCMNPNDEYIWIDNRKVRGITYTSKWSDLRKINKEILTFEE